MSQLHINESIALLHDSLIRNYQHDEDFDEAFKNLLRPIESIKKNHCKALQYELVKELDSYLNHLRESSNGSSSVFVEAALMMQNVILLYGNKVDQVVDILMKIIGKFRAYRINQNDNDNAGDAENTENNKKKKKEKKVKLYPSFEPINDELISSLIIFDCKKIILDIKSRAPQIVLNTNIKVNNKYSQILPYISVGNGENIGKKYDFMLNCPLNHNFAVNEEFDCANGTYDTQNMSLMYQKSSDPLPMDFNETDDSNNNILPSTPEPPINFDQTINDEICVPNVELPEPQNILNVSQIPLNNKDDPWALVLCAADNIYVDIPIVKKKKSKKEVQDNGEWRLPSYTIGDYSNQKMKLKSSISVDPAFVDLISSSLEFQRNEINKVKNKQTNKENNLFDEYDQEMEERLKNGEEPAFKEFVLPMHDNAFDYECFENTDDEEMIEGPQQEDNFQTYQKNVLDLEKHEQNQIDIINEQLEMRKRVQAWHDKLRPILEEEEKRPEFDIHEYGTQLLDCFNAKGEQKSFQELAGGLEKEEVSRYFLSTLMMANTSNLKIINTEDGPDKMKIELLKKERHHEELQVNIGHQVNQEQN